MKYLALPFLFLLLSQLSCALLGWGTFHRYDGRNLSILATSLYNQRLDPGPAAEKPSPDWTGDWLLRRERLQILDRDLKLYRPDLIVMQEMLAKRGSPTDFDKAILAAGALRGYEWKVRLHQLYRDTQEQEFHAVAVSLPLRHGADGAIKTSPLGVDGGYSFFALELENKPILLVNVQMPSAGEGTDRWYEILLDEIRRHMQEVNICPERLLLAGRLPGTATWNNYQKLLADLQLEDTAVGFCEIEKDCLTASPENEIFAKTSPGRSGSRVDRILVHRSARVTAARRVFDQPQGRARYASSYSLDNNWATRRFGWMSTVNLAACPDS